MASIVTRLSNTGTFFVNGFFDEITTTTNRIALNANLYSGTVYTALLDEVTLPNASSNPAMKQLQSGGYQVSSYFDEVTGVPIVDGSLLAWWDTQVPASWSGGQPTSTNYIYNLAPNANPSSYLYFLSGTATGAGTSAVTTATYSNTGSSNFIWFGAPYVGAGNSLRSNTSINFGGNNQALTVSLWMLNTTLYGDTSAGASNGQALYGYQSILNISGVNSQIRWQYSGGNSNQPGQISWYLNLTNIGPNPTLCWTGYGNLTTGTWYNIIGTYTGINNSQMQVWLNGTNLASVVYPGVSGYASGSFANSYASPYTISASSGQIQATNQIMNIGDYTPNTITGGNGDAFYGAFSNCMIYNRVLSPQEIAQNFQSFRGRFGI